MDRDNFDAALAELIGEVPGAPPAVETQEQAMLAEQRPQEPQIEERVLRAVPIAQVAQEARVPSSGFEPIDKACLGCGEVRPYHPGVGFPCCAACLKRLGVMTWDERMQIHARRRTIEQVIAARGRGTYGQVGDRLHVPAMFARATPTADIAEWAQRRCGTLVLHGPTGTGKSYQATGALRALIDGRDAHGYLVNCAGLSRMSRDEFQILSKAGALALDDFGARMTPACLASAYELIEARHGAMLPLIVTTNITLEGIIAVDERIGSRLGAGTWVAMAGADRRLQ